MMKGPLLPSTRLYSAFIVYFTILRVSQIIHRWVLGCGRCLVKVFSSRDSGNLRQTSVKISGHLLITKLMHPPWIHGLSSNNSNHVLFSRLWQEWKGRGNCGSDSDVTFRSMEMPEEFAVTAVSTSVPTLTFHSVSCLVYFREYRTTRRHNSLLKEDVRKRQIIEMKYISNSEGRGFDSRWGYWIFQLI
jgi:hypothetical protein